MGQDRAALWQWLKDAGITQEEAARACGYTVNYVNAVLNGREELTPGFRLRVMAVFPATAQFLLPAEVVAELGSAGVALPA